MGLDNYWVIPNPDWSGEAEPKHEDDYKYLPCKNPQWISNELPNVCGGMFSGNGSDGSFRGKVYADFLYAITGRSLYEEQDNESVLYMAEALACYVMFKGREIAEAKHLVHERNGGDFLSWSIADAPDLLHMFIAYGRAGAQLDHWY